MLFEQRFNLLKNLKTLWANDTAVLLTPIDVTDENDTQVIIDSNDEVVFENDTQVIIESNDEVVFESENKLCGEVVCQEISRVDHVGGNIQESSPENELPITHQTLQVNDVAWSTIKMPVAVKKRGRPKGQGLAVIGLPNKKKRNPKTFPNKSRVPFQRKD
uniref:Uncharacterized protein LOC114332708 n=1 Tax=Diabrotica virgifera virgifera TaxID=50390 RepID=A0A6P7FQ40_DIAVI